MARHETLIGVSLGFLLAAASLSPLSAWGTAQTGKQTAGSAGRFARSDAVLLLQARSIFGRLPDRMPGSQQDTPARIELGRRLYFEKSLSVNRSQSCNSCHPIDKAHAGADNEPISKGAMGQFGSRNAPTVLNAGFQISQFWDGRARDLVEQAGGPICNPMEMGMPDPALVIKRVREIKTYRKLFPEAFPGQKAPITYDHIAEAIASFERTLISRSRFDRFLAGDAGALSGREKEGLRIFMNVGCIRCHSGPLLGGMLYQKLGIYHPYKTKDLGRYEQTKKEADKFVFKVPMLRNVTLTAPYFHDGSVATLAEAVDIMAWDQLDVTLKPEQIDRLLRFLTAVADQERTTASPPAGSSRQTRWHPPSPATIPLGRPGNLIRYGFRLISETHAAPKPDRAGGSQTPAGNALACRNCHQERGTKQFGIPWVGVISRYPRFQARELREVDLPGRINGCFQRSLNGRALPKGGEEMKAIVAYMSWLSRDAPAALIGRGVPAIPYPDRQADLRQGKEIYKVYCQSCHGMNGAGYRSRSAGASGGPVVPPLWGKGSFNNGAGMHRLLIAAAFVRANMPLGTPWNRPVLSVGQAYDVAAYFNSFPRPTMRNLGKDYPDLAKKPIDCPYPPYADPFPQRQHRYGPFQPIKAYYRELKKQKN